MTVSTYDCGTLGYNKIKMLEQDRDHWREVAKHYQLLVIDYRRVLAMQFDNNFMSQNPLEGG